MINNLQARAGRALAGLSQSQLAKLAKINTRTLMDFESGKREPIQATLQSIQSVLENEGIEFIPENGGGAGVRLKRPSKQN